MSILKRIASVAAAAVMLAEGAVSAYAADGDFLYSKQKNGTLMLTKYKGTDTKVTIPAEINGFKVTELYDTFESLIEAYLPTIREMTVSIMPEGIRVAMEAAGTAKLSDAVLPVECKESDGLFFFTIKRRNVGGAVK